MSKQTNDRKSDTEVFSSVPGLTPEGNSDINFHEQQLAMAHALAERIKLLMRRSRSK